MHLRTSKRHVFTTYQALGYTGHTYIHNERAKRCFESHNSA